MPESLDADLLLATAPTAENPEGIDQSAFLREAVRERLLRLKNPQEPPLPSIPDLILQSVEAAVSQTLDATSIRVAIAAKSRPKLDDIADQLGYFDASELFKAFAVRMLNAPEEIEDFLKRPARVKSAKRVGTRVRRSAAAPNPELKQAA